MNKPTIKPHRHSRRITTLALAFIFLHGQAQTVVSSCTANPAVIATYKNDADRMAIRRLFAINSPLKDSVKIDPQTSNDYLKCLLAVHNATNLPARDTVVYLMLHAKMEYDLRSMQFIPNPSQQWVQNFRDSIFPTGYTTFDSVMNKYHFYRGNYSLFGTFAMATIKADSNSNIKALADIFNTTVTQTQGSGPNGYVGDGSDITDVINPAYTELTYKYGWGDCPSGCIYKRYWRFRIYNNCEVEYLGSYGSGIQTEIPAVNPPTGLSANAAGPGITAYPNPVNDKLTITGAGDFKYRCTDLLGREFLKGEAIEEINVSDLPAGIYFLEITAHNSVKKLKLVKE